MDTHRQTVIGISDAEEAQILKWFAELDGPCSTSRQAMLATQLSHALEGFMGIDKELLSQAFLCHSQEGFKASDDQRAAIEMHIAST